MQSRTMRGEEERAVSKDALLDGVSIWLVWNREGGGGEGERAYLARLWTPASDMVDAEV